MGPIAAPGIVAFWPHTENQNIASARLRCWRVAEGLRALGVDARVDRPGSGLVPRTVVMSKRYDAASLEQALALRAAHGVRVVLDLCDNHFHYKAPTPELTQRARHLEQAIVAADQVVASTEALRDVIREHCPQAPPIEVIGDLVDRNLPPPRRWRTRALATLELWRLRRWLSGCGVAEGRRLVWFGNHGSPNVDAGMQDMTSIRAQLEWHYDHAPLAITVISNNRELFESLFRDWRVPHAYLEWSSATFEAALALHDIALVPITDNPFTRCKTANRVVTAAVNGVAVVADCIPAYEEFRPHLVLDDWGEPLAHLMADGQARTGALAGLRAKIERDYSMPVICGRWRDILSR